MYKAYKLSCPVPNDEYEMNFWVRANVSCSDESDVGLSKCEVEIDYDYDSIDIECDSFEVAGWSEAFLKDYIANKLSNKEFDQEIYDKWCEDNDAYNENNIPRF